MSEATPPRRRSPISATGERGTQVVCLLGVFFCDGMRGLSFLIERAGGVWLEYEGLQKENESLLKAADDSWVLEHLFVHDRDALCVVGLTFWLAQCSHFDTSHTHTHTHTHTRCVSGRPTSIRFKFARRDVGWTDCHQTDERGGPGPMIW